MQVETLTPHLGAKVHGLDLSASLTDDQFSEIKELITRYGLLVFPGQNLTQEHHKRFAAMFGELHVHPMHHTRPDIDPHILTVKTDKNSAYTAGNGWHTDVTCDERPPAFSALYMKEVPECGGGDTLFANMYLAYELLSDSMKSFLGGLTAMHDGGLPYVGAYKSTPPEGGYPISEHPVITKHPESGQPVLYVNSGFTARINGLNPLESRSMLDMLYRFIESTPRLTARVVWEPGMLTLWDNRCTQHHAIWDYYPHSRYGERVSVVAEKRPEAYVRVA